jgi:hypothetical protein
MDLYIIWRSYQLAFNNELWNACSYISQSSTRISICQLRIVLCDGLVRASSNSVYLVSGSLGHIEKVHGILYRLTLNIGTRGVLTILRRGQCVSCH